MVLDTFQLNLARSFIVIGSDRWLRRISLSQRTWPFDIFAYCLRRDTRGLLIFIFLEQVLDICARFVGEKEVAYRGLYTVWIRLAVDMCC